MQIYKLVMTKDYKKNSGNCNKIKSFILCNSRKLYLKISITSQKKTICTGPKYNIIHIWRFQKVIQPRTKQSTESQTQH